MFASWVRDATPSFLNTLRRWKSTVAGLVNSREANSLLDRPSLTRPSYLSLTYAFQPTSAVNAA